MSAYIIPILILLLIAFSFIKKIKPYDAFTDGAKGAIDLTISVFPYLVGILLLSELFEISGLSNLLTRLLAPIFSFLGIPTELAKLVMIKPFSGSGSLAILTDIYSTYGVDSYISRCASCIYGSSETVFYVAAVYFAKAKNKKLFMPILISLIASFISCIVACLLCRAI